VKIGGLPKCTVLGFESKQNMLFAKK
jgi:hypothetical protein